MTRQAHFHSLFPGLGSIRRELEQAFNEVSASGGARGTGCQVPVSIWQDDQHVYVEVDVPGFRQADLDLRFEDGKLTIAGERTWSEDRKQVDYNERRFGKFERVVALSDTVDPTSIDAALEDGVLTVTLNKRVEAVPQSVKIRYRGESQDGGQTA